jgi:hypothetical protein
VGVLKGINCGPKQFWDFEDVFIMGCLGVHSFFLFNFLGFILWEFIWWCSYFEARNWVHKLP